MAKNFKINTGIENYLTRSESINAYLHDVRKSDVLSAEEEIALFKQIENGDEEAREKIINCNQRFVFAIAKNYANDEKIMDLVNEGNIGLIQAIDSFDYKKGNRFLSYAVWFIRRRINAYLVTGDVLIQKTNSTKSIYHLNKIRNKFFAENGRYPSDDELMDILEKKGVKLGDNSDLYDLNVNSISTNFDDDDKNAFENSSLFTSKTATINEYEEVANDEYNNEMASTLMEVLSSREKAIVEYAFGIGHNKTYNNSEIASELGMTSERVRQIKNEALKKMRSAALTYNL